ncbi:S49 family peptidase [Chryseobacterium taklimakanense]|uniref:S49 family peptidase n=1 Tax=Chryseobacterium taklimakanense TaxID=536441 RepID=UPI001EF54E80|nr:S49 family peptidase [Chryseobacterium taklimakanense]MCG7280366.1 S49 family peptidase [Chryseobacterium taklimakanense]
MPLTNLNSAHLTAAQVTAAQNALADLENALSAVNVNLTPEDRQRYGSINEQNKLFVNKVKDYRTSNPNLSVSDVDWDEFEKDFASRRVFDSLINRLDALSTKLKGAKILHDYDNYQSALADYAYTSYRAGTGADGYETKYNEMKQFFGRSGKTTAPPAPENP